MISLVSNNKQAHSAKRSADQPAPTITGGHDSGNRMWVGGGDMEGDSMTTEDPIRVTVEEAAILQSYPPCWNDRPATTVAGDGRIAGPGRSEFVKGGVSRQDRPGIVAVTVEEAGTLQTYPPFANGFQWRGSKTKQYMQIGNAVPPLQAQVVLNALWAIPSNETELAA